MHAFEVRILKQDQKPSRILVGQHTSVVKALKTARRVAKGGNILEVWRDNDCVHHEQLARLRAAVRGQSGRGISDGS